MTTSTPLQPRDGAWAYNWTGWINVVYQSLPISFVWSRG